MSGTKIIQLVFSRDKELDRMNKTFDEFRKMSYASKLTSSSNGKRSLMMRTNVAKMFGVNTVLFNDVELRFLIDDEINHKPNLDYDVRLFSDEHKGRFNTISSYIFKEMCDYEIHIGVVTHNLEVKYFKSTDVDVLENVLFGFNSYNCVKIDKSLDKVKEAIAETVGLKAGKCETQIESLEKQIISTREQQRKYINLKNLLDESN